MQKKLIVGILKENKNEWERRTPLTPGDVKWLVERGIEVEVESSPLRVFNDDEYRNTGARVVEKIKRASFLAGVKNPRIEDVLPGKIYMIFSHSVKGQAHSIPLLKNFIKKRVTLIDYEKITDVSGKRLVYFGRFAGICGMVDSLYYLGEKLKSRGIKNPFAGLKPAWKYRSLTQLKKALQKTKQDISQKGFDKGISPFIIGITGHGNVSRGAQEILEILNPVELHPRDMEGFIRRRKYSRNKIYKIVFLREEKLRKKTGKGYYFEEYLKYPDRFESNLDKFLPHLNMLLHTSYWDRRFPRIIAKDMIKTLYRKKNFHLKFIGDISCDVNGSIELTCKTVTPQEAVYTYDPKRDSYADGCTSEGISILAVDNLPAELPKDSSKQFSQLIRDYMYQIAAHGVLDLTNHVVIPAEIRRAVIVQESRLTRDYQYLGKYLR